MAAKFGTPAADAVLGLVARTTGPAGVRADNVIDLHATFGRKAGNPFTSPGLSTPAVFAPEVR